MAVRCKFILIRYSCQLHLKEACYNITSTEHLANVISIPNLYLKMLSESGTSLYHVAPPLPYLHFIGMD